MTDKLLAPVELEAARLNLPDGITLAKGFEDFPNLETIKTYIKTWTHVFVEDLIKEVEDSKTEDFTIIDAVSGSLLLHYLCLDSIKGNAELKAKIRSIYAIQLPGTKTANGQGPKKHFVSDQAVGETRLIDDIVDTAVSSSNIEETVSTPMYRMRALSFKLSTLKNAHKLGNGNIPYHVFQDEWIATCFGMNSGLGDTEFTKNNPHIRARMHEISILERTCCLPLALDDRLAADWGPEQVEQYISILKANSIFQSGEVPRELANMYDEVINFKTTVEVEEITDEQIKTAAEILCQKLKLQEAIILQKAEV